MLIQVQLYCNFGHNFLITLFFPFSLLSLYSLIFKSILQRNCSCLTHDPFVDLIHSYEMIKEEFVNVLMYSHIGINLLNMVLFSKMNFLILLLLRLFIKHGLTFYTFLTTHVQEQRLNFPKNCKNIKSAQHQIKR